MPHRITAASPLRTPDPEEPPNTDTDAQNPTALLAAAETDAIISGNRYLAFQVPESKGEACGRTFEDAFLLANPSAEELALTGDTKQDEIRVRDAVDGLKKSDFALRFAVDEGGWKTPRYIQRGLDWLLGSPPGHEAGSEAPGETGVVVR